MRFLIFALFFFATGRFSAQNFDWAVGYNKEQSLGGYHVCNDVVGNAYVTGGNYIPAQHGPSYESGFIAKYNAAGTLKWQKDLTDAKLYPAINSSDQLLIAGVDSVNCFVKTYDTSGTLLSNQLLFLRLDGILSGLGTDASGNYYVSGIFWDTLTIQTTTLIGWAGAGNFFLAKFNASQNLVWARNSTSGSLTKGCLFVDAVGNTYAGGEYLSVLTIGNTSITANNYDGFIVKYNSSGQFQWIFNQTGPGQNFVTALAVNNTGDVYSCGYYDTPLMIGTESLAISNGGYWSDIFFFKLTSNGVVSWAKKLGGDFKDFSHGISLNSNGNIFLGGSYSRSVTSTIATCTLSGTVLTSTTDVNIEPLIAKYDSDGNLLWATNTNSQPNSGGAAIGLSVNNHDRLFVTGYINTQMDFGGMPVSTDFQTMFLTRMSDGESTGIRPLESEDLFISLFPNPANGRITCEFSSDRTQTLKLTIKDLKGQVIINKNFEVKPGKNSVDIDPVNDLKGVYILEINAEGKKYTKKLVLN